MNMFIFKDGRVVVDDDPVYTGLDGLVVCVTNPQEGQVLTWNGSMFVNAAIPEPEETPDETEPAAEGGGGE